MRSNESNVYDAVKRFANLAADLRRVVSDMPHCFGPYSHVKVTSKTIRSWVFFVDAPPAQQRACTFDVCWTFMSMIVPVVYQMSAQD